MIDDVNKSKATNAEEIREGKIREYLWNCVYASDVRMKTSGASRRRRQRRYGFRFMPSRQSRWTIAFLDDKKAREMRSTKKSEKTFDKKKKRISMQGNQRESFFSSSSRIFSIARFLDFCSFLPELVRTNLRKPRQRMVTVLG